MFKKQIWHEFNINFDLQHNTYRIRDDTNYGFWAKPKRKKSIKINLATCSLRLKSYNEKKIQTEGNNKFLLRTSFGEGLYNRGISIKQIIPGHSWWSNSHKQKWIIKNIKNQKFILLFYSATVQYFTYMLQFFQVKIFKGEDCLLETLPTFSRNKTYWQENVKSLTMFPIFSLTLKLSDSLCCFLHENWVSK